jgi:hypothetical protein
VIKMLINYALREFNLGITTINVYTRCLFVVLRQENMTERIIEYKK